MREAEINDAITKLYVNVEDILLRITGTLIFH
jgi:hypothetical protein